jgi:hypothetical protein
VIARSHHWARGRGDQGRRDHRADDVALRL